MSKQITVTINVPRKGLIALWAMGAFTGIAATLPFSWMTAVLALGGALLSYLVGREFVRDVVRTLGVTVSDGETPACKN